MSKLTNYSNDSFGFSVSYPSGWIKTESMDQLGNVAVFSSRPIDEWSPNEQPPAISVTVLPVDPDMSLEELTRLSLAQMQQMLGNVAGIQIDDRTMGGSPGKIARYETTAAGLSLKFSQIWTLKYDSAFIVTFTATTSEFDTYFPIVQASFDTFQFIPRTKPIPAKPIELEALCLATYVYHSHNFALSYPNNWKVVSRKQISDPCVLVLTTNYEWKAEVKTLLLGSSLVVENASDVTNLEEYANLYKHQLSKDLQAISAVKLERTTLGEQPAFKSQYTDKRRDLKITRVFSLYKGKAYILSFSSNGSAEENRENAIFDRIIASFRLPNTRADSDTLQTYENLIHGFSLKFNPTYWVMSDGAGPITVTFVDFSTMNDPYPAHVNILVTKLGEKKLSLEDFAAVIQQQMRSFVSDLKLESESSSTFGGSPSKVYLNVGNLQSETGSSITIKSVQHVTIRDERAYLLTFSATAKVFDRNIDYQNLVQSFSFF